MSLQRRCSAASLGRRVLVVCAGLSTAAACSVSQGKSERAYDCTGVNCLDAAVDELREDGDDEPLGPSSHPDAGMFQGAMQSGGDDSNDGGTWAGLCAGSCALDDALACRPDVEEEPAPEHAAEMRTAAFQRLTGKENDAGISEDAGPDSDAPVVDAGPPLTQDASQPLNERACRVVPEQVGGELHFATACEPTGRGLTGAPCTGSRDCAPGLGCVGLEGVSQCRPFCCAGSCEAGQFCTQQPLRLGDMSEVEPPLVPVCVAKETCDLGEPFPCPAGADCSCPIGRTCTVVDETGATGCVMPLGSGEQDEPCPCAPGHICSEGSQTCHRLCKVAAASELRAENASECAEGESCVSNPVFPESWGLCLTLVQ